MLAISIVFLDDNHLAVAGDFKNISVFRLIEQSTAAPTKKKRKKSAQKAALEDTPTPELKAQRVGLLIAHNGRVKALSVVPSSEQVGKEH